MKKIQLTVICLLILVVSNVVVAEVTYEELIKKVEDQILALDRISTTAIIEVNQGGIVNRIVVSIEANISDKIMRVEILEPSIMAGQIMIADQEKDLVKMYLPAMNQIIIQSGVDVATNAGLGVDLTDLDYLYNSAETGGYIDQVVETENGVNYLVVINDLEEQIGLSQQFVGGQLGVSRQIIWINHEFIPFRFEVSESEQLYAILTLEDIAINEDVGDVDIQRLPNVPEVRY